jgi:hypothetical protein
MGPRLHIYLVLNDFSQDLASGMGVALWKPKTYPKKIWNGPHEFSG